MLEDMAVWRVGGRLPVEMYYGEGYGFDSVDVDVALRRAGLDPNDETLTVGQVGAAIVAYAHHLGLTVGSMLRSDDSDKVS